APGGLLLRADHPDLGGAGGRRDPRLRLDRACGSDPTRRVTADGSTAVPPHQRRLGFTLSLWGTLAPLALPLSSHPVAALSARPTLLALTVTGAASLGVAGALGSSLSCVAGFFGA